jgi:hypothetical protein
MKTSRTGCRLMPGRVAMSCSDSISPGRMLPRLGHHTSIVEKPQASIGAAAGPIGEAPSMPFQDHAGPRKACRS